MAQEPQQQPLGKITPVPASTSALAPAPTKAKATPAPAPKPTAPPGPPPRPTDADLEALITKAERGGDLGDVDVVVWMAQVQAATVELARRKAVGEYGKPWVEVPVVAVAPTVPEPPVSDERLRYERLREQWVVEHPHRRAAYEAWCAASADGAGEQAPTFDPDPTAFLTTACAGDATARALAAVECELREKFDAAARAMGFPGA